MFNMLLNKVWTQFIIYYACTIVLNPVYILVDMHYIIVAYFVNLS